jgi:hypothetical protein
MAFDYASLATTAAELIAEFGQSLSIRAAASGGTYDPVTGETTPGGPDVETAFNGVPLNITEEYATEVGTQNIRVRDQLVYAEPGMPRPTMSDLVQIGTEWWQIVNIVEIAPGGLPLLYILQVRPT